MKRARMVPVDSREREILDKLDTIIALLTRGVPTGRLPEIQKLDERIAIAKRVKQVLGGVASIHGR